MGQFYKTFKEELIFQKIEEVGILLNPFCTITKVTLIPKLHKDIMRKEKLQANISGQHTCKNLQQNASNLNSTAH